ncbi:MAG: hypothetical protein CMF74_01000 [Maricaulis sp.]|jgi:hypothetical protein|nr:hypothetical protein [Maricaulis sp.]HAQ34289.1 hypothetical protein [Alphaproteobacteria bacterium]
MTASPDPRRLAGAGFDAQRAFLIDAVLAEPGARAVLSRTAKLVMPDWALMAGAIYKPVWNALTGRDPAFGINDYDLAYCDPDDLSWEAEDVWIKRGEAVFAGFPREVEIRNQARVPIWFSRKFGADRPPIRSTQDAVSQFASKSHAIALRLDADGQPELIAPYGLDELFSGTIRPLPGIADPAGWNRKCAENSLNWPEIVFEEI